MASFEGYLGQAPDGGARLFLRDDVERFVDFDPAEIRRAQRLEQPGTPLAVYRVELSDEASARSGRLDPQQFGTLFAAEAGDEVRRATHLADAGHVGTYLVCEAGPAGRWPPSYDCETGYRRCHSIQIC